ncbi:uncharacterized protein ARMOST_06025 [Armillaria ostoyae]|uniref:F-box domain-containing protein n=1 Tax=Armillaria ostoyae TaxID=47428 RepID=A0A284R1U9_ARMOS|nr:uncharacterized protein ARMOST_06025 [Armillaria ostoyae]
MKNRHYISALSPIRLVPVEILTLILQYAVDDPYNVFDLANGPWVFGRVCSKWRAITEHESCCWANMAISCRVEEKGKGKLAMLQHALTHSKNQPLSFSFACTPYNASGGMFFLALISNSTRWTHVSLCIGSTLISLLPLVHGKLPRLSYLKSRNTGAMYCQAIFAAFKDAPKLRVVHLDTQYAFHITLPFSNLVEFRHDRGRTPRCLLTAVTVRHYLDFIQHNTKLQSFYMITYSSDLIRNVLPLVHNSSLRELTASEPSLIRSLILPSLEVFNLHVCDPQYLQYADYGPHALQSLIKGSQCSLVKLSVYGVRTNVIGSTHFIDILRLSPSLQELSLEWKEWNTLVAEEMDYLVKSMSVMKHSLTAPSAVEVIPQLERLQLCIDIPATVDPFIDAVANVKIDHAFVDMICCRPRLSTKVSARARGIPLTRRPFVIGDSELDRLREMRRDGHDISIEVYEGNAVLDVL